MAVIYEEALKSRIKTGKLAPVYIISGDDGYLKKMYVDKILGITAGEDDVFDYHRFDESCDLQEVYDAVTQLPVTADRKCVILRDYDFEKCSKSDFDRLCLLAGEGTDTCVLILWYDSLEVDIKKSSKYKKLAAAAEKCGGGTVLLNHRRAPELVKMLTDGAAKRGCRMDSSAARYLVETAGDDINVLANELEKLCCYASGGEITKSHIDLVSVRTVEESVYNLSKQIFARQAGDALRTLDELLYMQIDPMTVLYTVSSSYVDMYRLCAFKKSRLGAKDAAEVFGYKNKEFLLERAGQNLSKFNFSKLSLSLEALVDADRRLKSKGADERTVLEQLIVRLIYIIAKGEAVDKA